MIVHQSSYDMIACVRLQRCIDNNYKDAHNPVQKTIFLDKYKIAGKAWFSF